MYLKSLTLHGFKTFATRTHFAFEPGITAIVGPNGSGKSNVADAIRWVLGEQSLRSLRGRRTEDVLFAGGSGRPPAGMAEVGLTFDNSHHWLDVPFSEVSIVRRAYRSGENEYYLNRDRVRLRDVTDVLGRISLNADGFAVVGQGTVDAALSLRPEDRRGLIEQAAAIEHLFVRLEEARGRLLQTQQNLDRVTDLVAEITPRLRTLERQARQAREREALQAEFLRGLIRWYAHLLFGPLSRQDAAIADRHSALARAEAASAALAEAERRLEKALSSRHEHAEQVRLTTDRLNHRRSAILGMDNAAAIDRNREESLRQRQDEYRVLLQQQCDDYERERGIVDELTEQITALSHQKREAENSLESIERSASQWQEERRILEQRVHETRERHTRASTRHAGAVARQRATRDRLNQLERSLHDNVQRVAELQTAASVATGRVEACQSDVVEAGRAHEQAREERRRVVEAGEALNAELARQSARLAAVERDVQTLKARLDALHHVETSGTGYFSGVRAILQAANGHGPVHLEGVVGIVATLLIAPREAELAIETALGSHVQDVVVARWTDAEAAVAHLKKTGAGRATFLPLDTLRAGRRHDAPRGDGILGIASDLVTIDRRYAVVSDFLLGQTLVVRDLSIARHVLHECPPGWQLVTLEGEITRPSGVVTGGSPAQSRGTLARQRELRDVREEIDRRTQERQAAVAAVDAVRVEIDRLATEVTLMNRSAHEAEERVRQAQAVLADAQRQAERTSHGLAVRQEEIQRLTVQEADARQAIEEASRQVADAERAQVDVADRVEEAERGLAEFERQVRDQVAILSQRQAERDAIVSRLKAVRTAMAQAEARCQNLRDQIHHRQTRSDDVARAIDELSQARAEREVEAARLGKELAQTESMLADLTNRADEFLRDERRMESEAEQLRETRRQAAEQAQDAERRLDRAEAEVDGLRQQVALEIGQIDDAAMRRGELRVALPDTAELVNAIEPAAEAERLRARLDALRSRLRGIPVGLEAIGEYESARERLEFMNGQSADLQQTIATLRQAIDETRCSMKTRFDATFASVAAGFTHRFVELFGGGTARLVVAGDDEGSGIEVIAQPPGKRAENLSMLSGGERALTAAAFLFALIEANPPPFCVLDEVDAALDESNVGRFCAALRSLGERTQFVVITHNRRTMEAASTIYGLTVENRSESRVLAMQLPGA